MIIKSKTRDYIIFLGVFLSNMCVAIESFGVAVSANIFQGVFAVDNTWIAWLVPGYLLGLMTATVLNKNIHNFYDQKTRYCFVLLASALLSFIYFFRMPYILFCCIRYLLGIFGGVILSHSADLLRQIPSENYPRFLRTFNHHVYEVCLGFSALLGGVLSQYFQWRFIFLVEIVFYFVSMLLLFKFLTQAKDKNTRIEKSSVSYCFIVLLFVGSLYTYLSQIKEPWNTLGFWSNFSWVFLILTLFSGWLYVKCVGFKQGSFIDWYQFKNPYVALGLFGSMALRMVSFGPLIFLSKLMVDVYQFQYSSMGLVMGSFAIALLFWGCVSHALFHAGLDPKKLIYLGIAMLACSCFFSRYLTILSEPKFLVILIFFYSLGISFLLHSSLLFEVSKCPQEHKSATYYLTGICTLFASILIAPILKIVLVFRYTYHFLIFSEQAGQARSAFFYFDKGYEAFSQRHSIPGLYSQAQNAKVYLAEQIHKQSILAGFDDFCFLLGIFFILSLIFFQIFFARFEKNKALTESNSSLESH